MKLIAWTHPVTGLAITYPCEGNRLVTLVIYNGITIDAQIPTRLENVIGIVTPQKLQLLTVVDGEDDNTFIQRVALKAIPNGVPFTSIEDNAIPVNRRWRGAWKLNTNIVEVDIVEAKKIRKSEILKERDIRLDQARKDYLAADEQGKSAQEIKAKKDKAKLLSSLDQTIDGQLAVINDLNTLETFQPIEFTA